MISAKANDHTIVVVEDDQDTGDMLEIALSMDGYSVRVASDRDDAMEIITATEPSVILLDYYGVTSDLKEFISCIRAVKPDVPIVLVTGAREPMEKARDLGLDEFLAKPFDSEKLGALLSHHCSNPGSLTRKKDKMRFRIF